MTDFKTPTAADFAKLAELDNLTDADLLAPIGTGDTAVDSMLSAAPARALKAVPVQPAPPVPELAYLLAQAQAVLDCTLSSELPPRVVYAVGISAEEPVSYHFRAKGGELSEDLRKAVGGNIKTVQDIEYAVRLFAAHALSVLHLNQYSELSMRERSAAAEVHTVWQDRLKVAAVGELAAIDASNSLSAAEFKFLLELVDTDRAGMAQNLAGPGVNVPALVAGRGKDWRAIADAWAGECKSRGTVSFEGVGTATAGCSYNLEVQPGDGWVLSQYIGQIWVPVEACVAGQERAIEDRRRIARDCAREGRPVPRVVGGVADKLQALV